MNSKDIFDGITGIRDDLIDGAKTAPKAKSHWRKAGWIGAVAAVLVIAVLVGVFRDSGSEIRTYAIAKARYPQMNQYPTVNGANGTYNEDAFNRWWDSVSAQRRDLGDTSDLQSFFAQSSQAFLTEINGENKVCSPLNVYLALSMLAQVSDGESREQLLNLLGSDDIEKLRQRASDVWNCNYRDDGTTTSILASSLWLNEKIKFNQETMDLLAHDFYASSYSGEMGSEELDKALQDWLNEQTGGILREQAGTIHLDRETILALASTVYFRAKWHSEFSEENTAPRTFHAPDGDTETDFMNQRNDQQYYWGDKFAAVDLPFESGSTMWFLLPDEGVTPEELLSDTQAMDFLFAANRNEWENSKFLFVNMSVPKFDVSSQLTLDEGLKALGITDVFDPSLSDFTPMTAEAGVPIAVSQISHAARVVIDEEGCTAAAFTLIPATGAAAPPDEEVDFVLDRPFLFCITGESSLPLFVGVVNRC